MNEKPFHSGKYQSGFRSREPAAVRKCSTAPITQPSTVVHSTSGRLSRTVCLSYEIRPYLRSCLQISWKILSLALSTTQQSDMIHQNVDVWPSGAGKSAIAQSIADMCFQQGKLAASFFFSRNASSRTTTKRGLSAPLSISLSSPFPRDV